jgi:hypothetical protein
MLPVFIVVFCSWVRVGFAQFDPKLFPKHPNTEMATR